MYVNKIIDPRGPLELASRDELYAYAKANNVTEIDEAMYMGGYAAERMKKILIAKGLTNLRTALQNWGARPVTDQVREQVQEQQRKDNAMSVDDLVNIPQQPLPPRTVTINKIEPANAMTRAELAKECKRRGIKMQRTDTKEKLQERLSVTHAA